MIQVTDDLGGDVTCAAAGQGKAAVLVWAHLRRCGALGGQVTAELPIC